MRLNLKENEYFEVYFNDDTVQIMFGHIYYNIKYGFVQVFRDSFKTPSIKEALVGFDSRCASYIKDIKEYMSKNKYYFSIYKLKDEDTTYFIKEEISNNRISTGSNLFELIENNILNKSHVYRGFFKLISVAPFKLAIVPWNR